MPTSFTIRRLGPQDVSLFKQLRLEALQLEPGVYGSNYAKESQYPEEEWLRRLSNNSAAFYALYHNDDPIGITGVVVDWNDAESALMIASYIRKPYRSRGLSRLFYEQRLAWAREKGLKTATVGHRESNLASKRANQHFRFQFIYREPVNWPDGTSEDILYYKLTL